MRTWTRDAPASRSIATIADRLARLDERAPDVGVLDQALPVGDAAGLRVPDGRGGTRLGHRDDQVGLGRVLRGEAAADLHPGRVDAAARDRGIRPGQVDVLEQAAARPGRSEGSQPDAALADGDQLTRLDLADEVRADDVQGRRLARDDPALAEPAEHE